MAGAGLLLPLVPAIAQAQGQWIVIEQAGSPPRQEGQVRIRSSINFFIAGPSGESEEAQRLRDRARRLVYEMAAHECECDLLCEVLAKDCRMEPVNVNLGRQFGQQQQEGYTVKGSMNLQVSLK